jgi:hypothetical protein
VSGACDSTCATAPDKSEIDRTGDPHIVSLPSRPVRAPLLISAALTVPSLAIARACVTVSKARPAPSIEGGEWPHGVDRHVGVHPVRANRKPATALTVCKKVGTLRS